MYRSGARSGLLFSLIAVAALACGGKSSAPPAQTAAAPASAAVPAPAPISDVRARVDANADLVVYLDARGFRQSRFFAEIENAIAALPVSNAGRARFTKECGFDLIVSVEEVALSISRFQGTLEGSTALFAAKFSEPPQRVLDCLARLEPTASAIELEGRKALAWQPNGLVFAADEELVLAGGRERLVSAVKAPRRDLPAMSAARGYLSLTTNVLQELGLNASTFSVGSMDPGTRLRFEDEAPSDAAAAQAERKFRELRELIKQAILPRADVPEAKRHVSALLDSVVIERKGTLTSATLELPREEDEERFTGMLAGLVGYSMKTYLTRAKNAEARVMVPRIAQALATHAASKGSPRFPKSAPRTPKDVPAGTKFTSDAQTWNHASWKAIGFQIEDPQLYAYEYETSADGKRATVRAHGDLDGDGVTSRFELDVEITAAGEIVIGPEMKEADPLE